MTEYSWFFLDNGKRVYRAVKERTENKRSDLPSPYFRQDSIAPCLGMDGRVHTTLSGYRATLRPDGNPKGERYLEIGNEATPAYKAPEFDRKKRRDDIKRTIAEANR